jgi:hypothetical protein
VEEYQQENKAIESSFIIDGAVPAATGERFSLIRCWSFTRQAAVSELLLFS